MSNGLFLLWTNSSFALATRSTAQFSRSFSLYLVPAMLNSSLSVFVIAGTNSKLSVGSLPFVAAKISMSDEFGERLKVLMISK